MNTKNSTKTLAIAIIVACLALAGCASPGAATPTATQPPQPPITETAAITPTETPAPAATLAATSTLSPASDPMQPTPTKPPAPENTQAPTATSYPAPASPLSPTGPWLIFRAGDYASGYYLWAMNPDGTGLTRLTDERICTFAIQPNRTVQSGLVIAYSTSLDGKCQSHWEAHPGLIKILSGPERSVKTIVYDLSQGAEDLTWSPSGNKLAFIGAMGDTDSNVFVYDVATEESVRVAVTDGGDCDLFWSPDERYVIHRTGCTCSMGMCGLLGIWSSRADAGGVTQLVGYAAGAGYPAWRSPTEITIMLEQWMSGTSNTEIRLINIETGVYTTLINEPLLDIAYSPGHNMYLMTKESTPAPNRLLVFYQNGERREVSGYTIKQVEWLSAYDTFLGQTPDGRAYLISPAGTVTEIPTPKWDTFDSRFINSHSVIVSPDNQWWAWFHRRWTTASSASELWVGPAKGQPPVRLSTSLGLDSSAEVSRYDISWSPDSQYLLWGSDQGLFVAGPPGFGTSQIWSASPETSPTPDWLWSLDSRYLLLFSKQGIFVASPPDFKATLVADTVGWSGGFWIR